MVARVRSRARVTVHYLWRYASPIAVLLLGGIVWFYVSASSAQTCGSAGGDSGPFCATADGPINRLLLSKAIFLKIPSSFFSKTETPANDVLETLGIAHDIDVWLKKNAMEIPISTTSVLSSVITSVGSTLANDLAEAVRLLRASQDFQKRDESAWIRLASNATAARTYWMTSLGGLMIVLILFAGTSVLIGARAVRVLSFEMGAVAFLLGGWVLAIIATWSSDVIFPRTEASTFVEHYLNPSLSQSVRPAQTLFIFSAVAMLFGASLRLVVPKALGAILIGPNEIPMDDAGKTAQKIALWKGRAWLTEVLADLDLAILVVAFTLTFGVWQIYTLLSWPLALGGGCGTEQPLQEMQAACAAVSSIVFGSGVMGTLILGTLVLPAFAVSRELARRLSTLSAIVAEGQGDPAPLGGTAWGTIAKIATILAPFLSGMAAQVSQALGSAGP
ncbi:MAG TPA: hypothetical protein VHL31_03150 [Geminicoccus sp.]|jgi:hypothetical protein|uniref:hypothetical protein n=1 Tax=Geminicoccus sp. TaxID=2024832 RepID=UPI002E379463|nr:hypothetical protein [Geminicoccus sp.]HEX2525283.1 hypothetical protein [Geminicoccus sp.]